MDALIVSSLFCWRAAPAWPAQAWTPVAREGRSGVPIRVGMRVRRLRADRCSDRGHGRPHRLGGAGVVKSKTHALACAHLLLWCCDDNVSGRSVPPGEGLAELSSGTLKRRCRPMTRALLFERATPALVRYWQSRFLWHSLHAFGLPHPAVCAPGCSMHVRPSGRTTQPSPKTLPVDLRSR